MGHDLRRYSQRTNLGLVIGFILILILVGDGLIYFFYGRSAAAMGLICTLVGLAPVTLIAGALWIIDSILRANKRG